MFLLCFNSIKKQQKKKPKIYEKSSEGEREKFVEFENLIQDKKEAQFSKPSRYIHFSSSFYVVI
jgi:hypothetical protein